MDALILSCGTGGGHNSAGRAIEQELTARGHGVTFMDPYLLNGPRTSSMISNAYISLAQRAPSAFGALYALGGAVRRIPGKSPVYYANRGMSAILEKYLSEHPCDAIVMPHLFPAEIITSMKRRGMYVPKTFFIATDYTCIPFTEETDCDFYIIPAPSLTEEFLSRGIPEERVMPLGIPVRHEFKYAGGRASAREKLGLDPDKMYILVAGGSIGAGNLCETVGTLLKHYRYARIVVVCGSNRALYDRLRRDFGGKCALLGYTSDIADYMRASDIFISKPGGLSSTEAAVIGTALIHVTPIPGCETKNMAFFSENGMSIPVKSPKAQLWDACDRLLDASVQREMLENQRNTIPHDSTDRICDLIEASVGADKRV